MTTGDPLDFEFQTVDYASKCKRRRSDGPTPCLCCPGECVGEPPRRRILLALTGLAGSGKSTAAMHLVERHGYTRLRFAEPLKVMLLTLGLDKDQVDGSQKEVPCDLLCGRTPRHAMQTMGTEWGRDLIGPDLWVRAWRVALDRVPPSVPVVVDDCRFPNEVEAIRAAGGVIVRIDRPGAGAGAAGHASEGYRLPADFTIRNDGTLAALFREVDQLRFG